MEKNYRNNIVPNATGDNRWIYCDSPLTTVEERWLDEPIASSPADNSKKIVIFNSIDLPFPARVSSLGTIVRSSHIEVEAGLYSSSGSGAPDKKLISSFVSEVSDNVGKKFSQWDFAPISLNPGRYHFALYPLGSDSRNYTYGGIGYWGKYNTIELNPHLKQSAANTVSCFYYDGVAAGLNNSTTALNLPGTLSPEHLHLKPVGAIGKEHGVIDSTILWPPPFFALRLEP